MGSAVGPRDAAQELQWLREFGTAGSEVGYAVAVDASDVYVAGPTDGALPGQTNAGGNDAFLRKYDADGTEVWTRQFGSLDYDDAESVAADVSGIYVVGLTAGTLPGQTSAGLY